MIINRDYSRTYYDDLALNVLPRMSKYDEAEPIYYNNDIIGWRIILQYS